MKTLRTVQSNIYPFQCSKGTLLIVTDAWEMVNGVVTTVTNLVRTLRAEQYEVEVIHPFLFETLPTTYPGLEITNPFGLTGKIARKIEAIQPKHIFIVTEGPLGWAARNVCMQKGIPFVTNYTTKWPEYFNTYYQIPLGLSYHILRQFHHGASAVLVATSSLYEELQQRGFKQLVHWSRGVDLNRFSLMPPSEREAFITRKGLAHCPRPFYLFVGRVSSEKNIQAFLNCELPGTKIVVGPAGSGMSLETLRQQYPEVIFTGLMQGDELSGWYGSSDVFVFPSRTDTFGLAMIEALACGLPVVGFNVTGPRDILPSGSTVGFLAEAEDRLQAKALQAWQGLQSGQVIREDCQAYAQLFSWQQCAQKLLQSIPEISWESDFTALTGTHDGR